MMATTTAGSTTTRSPLLPLVVLSLCGFTSVTTELLPSGLLTRIAPDLGTGIAPAGALTSVYAGAIVVTVLPLTRLTLRVPRRVLFVAVLGAFVAGNVLVALSPTLPVAIVGRVLAGISHGLLWATMAPTVAHITSPEQAGRAMAIVFAGNSLGLAAGTPLGTLLGEALGWRWAFLVLAGVSAGLAVLAFIVMPDVRPDIRRPLPLVRVVRLPGVGQITVGWAFMFLAHFAVFTYIAPFLERGGVDGRTVGVAIAVIGVTSLLGVVMAGRVPRRGLYVGTLAAPALMLVGFLGMLVLPLGLTVALILLSAWGIGSAAATVFNQQVILVVGRDAPDTVTSVSVVITQLGIALGAALGGLTVDTIGVPWVPLTGIIFAAGSIALLINLHRYLPQPRAAATN